MTKTLTRAEILEMPVSERLRLIETLWGSIDSNDLPVPESHLHALDTALADYERNPNEGRSWDEVREELFPRPMDSLNLEWLSILMTRELSAFSRELDLFEDESLIWSRVPGIANSAGNLTLHVCGNLQHFVGAILGGTGYVRDREREFSARGIGRAELQASLAGTSDVVRTVLSGLSGKDLNGDFPELPGGLRVPFGLFLLHLSTHLAFHLGQAGYLRRLLTGENHQSSGAMAIRALAVEPPPGV